MIKVKELKSDALVQVPVNRGYYIMVKNLAMSIVSKMEKNGKSSEYIKEISNKKYQELDEEQQSLQTVALLLAEIENQAQIQKQYDEKEILEPGDEGYVAPTVD